MPLLLILIGLFFLNISSVNAQPKIAIISGFSSIGSTEWVEILNNSDQKIILNGWTIVDSNTLADDIALDGCIDPGKRRTFHYNRNGSTNGWLNDTEDTITLKDSQGMVDDAPYGGNSSLPAPKSGMALIRMSIGDTWTEVAYTNYTNDTCTMPPVTPTNTPSVTNTPSPSPAPTVPTNTPTPTANIQITSFPSLAHVYQSFSMRFETTNLKPDTYYNFKAIGGINDKESLETFWINKWYGYTAVWDNMPKFKTDSSGRISNSISMRVLADKPIGEYKIQIRYRESGTDDNRDSDIKYVTIKERIPSPTDSPVPTPTPTDAPVTTPAPEDLAPTQGDTFYTTASTLGSSNEAAGTPTAGAAKTSKTSASSSRSIVPILFMVSGGLFLLIPVVLSQLKHVKKTN